VGSPPIRQQALTVIAYIRPGARDPLEQLLRDSAPAVLAALARVTTLHFGRFVTFDDAKKRAALGFESNYDGDLAAHVAELHAAAGKEIGAFYALCEDYSGDLEAFFVAKAQPAPAFYLGHAGLSVAQILHDEKVRNALEEWLDDADARGALASMSPRDLRKALQQHLQARALDVGPVDRGLPPKPWAPLSLYAMVPGLLVVAAVTAIIARFHELSDDAEDAANPPKLITETEEDLLEMLAHEDASAQNAMTHVVPIKPGLFRGAALRITLWVVDQVRRRLCFEGNLHGISSIHFARWVIHDGDTLVFFTNYDGSWEAYLGDFIDKAHIYLTAVWTNTRWFPRTRFLVFDGASQAVTFKRWARTFQRVNPIWYSAYPDVTVENVLRNAQIRAGASGDVSDDETKRWLALL
jgi:hypothetical protein